MDYASSNLSLVAEAAKRNAPDVAAQAASKAASRLIQSPLVAQLTVRAIESALENTHVALPGANDKAALIELKMESVLEAKSTAAANRAKSDSVKLEDQKALDQIKAAIQGGRFSIDYRSIASSLLAH